MVVLLPNAFHLFCTNGSAQYFGVCCGVSMFATTDFDNAGVGVML